VDIKPSYGLTDDDIERMLEESIDFGEQDLEQRLLIASRNDADQILMALEKQLREYGNLVAEDERLQIEDLRARLELARRGQDRELLSKLVEELNDITTPFAGRIMDSAIKLVLEKKSIEELT
jgi:molecular chaperone DnaK (HSP70)